MRAEEFSQLDKTKWYVVKFKTKTGSIRTSDSVQFDGLVSKDTEALFGTRNWANDFYCIKINRIISIT